tara:strand:+ start:1354 stop:2874 length:1521 start_codon:yes stop_codon:yes gene_type:complete
MATPIYTFFKNFLGISNNDKDDNIDSKMTIKKINLFINHSILLNYFDSYNKKDKNHKANCHHIETILSNKFYNKLNINDKDVVLLDTKFIEQRDKYRRKINSLLSTVKENKIEKAPEEEEAPAPEKEAPAPEKEAQAAKVEEEENFIRDSICEYINYIFYNYYVLLQAYYMFHNYKIVITNDNVSNEITKTNIFFKFIEIFIDTTNIGSENINGENINGENIKKKDENIDITEFIDLLRYDTSYKNPQAIEVFKCSVRSNAIEIIKNGKERLFFNKTFNYQLLNETNEKKNDLKLDEMEDNLKKFKQIKTPTTEKIVNYGIKKQIIEFNKNHNNLINKNDNSNLCYLKNKILKLKTYVKNKITNSKNYTVNLETVKTDIEELINTYVKKKEELYENLIENKIFNISDTNFKYIEDVILYDLHTKSLNTIKYNTEKIFYEFFIEFYETLKIILKKIETKAPTPAEVPPAPTPAPEPKSTSGGRKKIKTKRIKKFKRRKTRRKTRRKN